MDYFRQDGFGVLGENFTEKICAGTGVGELESSLILEMGKVGRVFHISGRTNKCQIVLIWLEQRLCGGMFLWETEKNVCILLRKDGNMLRNLTFMLPSG